MTPTQRLHAVRLQTDRGRSHHGNIKAGGKQVYQDQEAKVASTGELSVIMEAIRMDASLLGAVDSYLEYKRFVLAASCLERGLEVCKNQLRGVAALNSL